MAVFRNDPYHVNNFLVQVSGISDDPNSPRAAFAEVSGIGLETAVIEHRTGDDPNATVQKMPGLTRYTNVTLKRGVIGDLTFWSWVRSVVTGGKPVRATVTITLLDEQRNAVQIWRLLRAWPCKYSGPAFDAKGSEVAIESLELAYEGLELE